MGRLLLGGGIMRYYKITDTDGHLIAIGTGSGGVEITEDEYTALSVEIRQKAELVASLAAGDITQTEIREDWRDEIVRRADATSAHVNRYTQETLEEMTKAELEQILSDMGVSVNMTKANMVTLIMALQEGEET